jgi:transposase
LVGVERWAEIRRMHRVERLSIREISRRTGRHRDTIRRALSSDAPPRYVRAPVESKLDPFRDWICERLREDPAMQSLRLRELATRGSARSCSSIHGFSGSSFDAPDGRS